MSASTKTELRVNGMTCNNCARAVTEAIQGTPGVQSATISLVKKTATVRWKAGQAKNVAVVLAAITKSGYEAAEIDPAMAAASEARSGRWEWNLILCLGVTFLLMVGEWVFGRMLQPWFQWTAFVLAGMVQVFGGAPFYRGAWNQLKVRSSNMDTLVALGSTTAFGYSTWALLFGAGGQLYFMEAAAIISLISFGHWLEARVSEKAGGALKSLLTLAPATARKLAPAKLEKTTEPGGKLDLRSLSFGSAATVSRPKEQAAEVPSEVPMAELVVGDRVVLLPGDRVPVDGRVVEGSSAVEEAMLTGEAMPVEKQSGSDVFAGTVNTNGRLVVEVTRTGEATALANVIAAVQRAQTSRAGIQRLGDRISNVFVPVVTVIALLSGLGWGLAPQAARRIHDVLAQFLWHAHLPVGPAAGFIIAAGVLIVACPCAMGLATPAAIMASANTAARRGILIRDGVALEKAGRITAVVFDKTGTLTVGRPGLVAEKAFGQPRMAPDILAAALARNSTHPVSQAIAKLSADTVSLADWQEIRGCGVQAMTSDSGIARLGSLTWLAESGADLAGGEAFISEWSKQGATLVGLTLENRLAALFAVQDHLKTDAARVLAELRRQKLKIFLVTGDASLTAASIGLQVGIAAEAICAGVRPEAKAEFVGQLQARGERVAFVGDGINDAPALSRADLGIAVSRASDIAREAADIILLKSEIGAVPECLGLARATLRTIRQNLFWAFFYNALGVPLAALGFISPVFCAVAMGGSDLIVIGNALRLLRWRR